MLACVRTPETPEPTQNPIRAQANPLQIDLRALQGVLREEEIHVISGAIAEVTADGPHTI